MIVADSFVHTILAQPDADAPRLVCADWLEEQGDPLAELIRLQCELAQLDDWDPRLQQLQSREQRLREIHDSAWLGPLRQWNFSWQFERGFLEVSISGVRTFLDVADRLFSLPWVLHVFLKDGAASPQDLRDLAASSHFARVRRLDLSRCQMGNDGVRLLTQTEHPCRLIYLNLNHNQISSLGVRILADSLDLSPLTELRLYGNGIGPVGARALSQSPDLGRLRVLDLSYNDLRTNGADSLSEALSLNQIQSLFVRGNSIGAQGKRALRRRFGARVHLGSTGSLS